MNVIAVNHEISICHWLFTIIDKMSEIFQYEEFDDPGTIVNKLMLGLRQVEFKSSFPSQRLKTGLISSA